MGLYDFSYKLHTSALKRDATEMSQYLLTGTIRKILLVAVNPAAVINIIILCPKDHLCCVVFIDFVMSFLGIIHCLQLTIFSFRYFVFYLSSQTTPKLVLLGEEFVLLLPV